MSTRECPSCGNAHMRGSQCDYCGLDLAALSAPVAIYEGQNLTEADAAALPLLLKVGRRNPWISGAYDPPFNERSFYRCGTAEELREKFEHGNWCSGQAFGFGDLWFIEQGDGNDEWLTIKLFDGPAAVAFESISWRYIITRKPEEFAPLLADLLAATEEQCRSLTYRDARHAEKTPA